ncbi:MAG TPA: hypothetical protein VHF07_08840, partial [Nitrospiraceae bacterium]|nr:hypothetical protein [Nitrospiraceae bacterium]
MIREKLQSLLSPALGPAVAQQIVDGLARASDRKDGLEAVLVLLGELQDLSAKAALAAIEALPELERRGVLTETVQWLDLGLAFAHASGAATLRYMRESPLLISLVEPASVRRVVLASALELVEEDHTVAMEFLRVAPELVPHVASDELGQWAELALNLAQRDSVVGIELMRRSPAVAQVLSRDDVNLWIDFGLKLVTTNSLGKTDYFGTVEFFRTSPSVLADIHPPGARPLVLKLGSRLADSTLELGTTCLAEAPPLLARLPSDEWRIMVLQYGLLLAERDGQASLEYFRRAPEIVSLLGTEADARSRFEQWLKTGVEILDYSVEAGRAYFAVASHQAIAAVEQALSGVPLRRIARSLTLFAEALCGRAVTLQALTPEEGERPRAVVTREGLRIKLPSLVGRYAGYEENARLYMVMTAHEAGHAEFGTYDLAVSRLSDLVALLQEETDEAIRRSPTSLADLFALYRQPGLIRDLWTILEDARVEFLLKQEYPGLRRHLSQFAAEAVKARTLSHGLTVRELIVDQLLLLSTATEPESVAVPDAIVDIVAELWSMCRTVLASDATAETTVRTAHHVYVRLDELLAQRAQPTAAEPSPSPDEPAAVAPRASEEMSAEYRPVTNWDYRGVLDPTMVREQGEESPSASEIEQEDIKEAGIAGQSESNSRQAGTARTREGSPDGLASGRDAPSLVDQVLDLEGVEPSDWAGDEAGRLVRYPEWDATIQDYRSHWCSVFEREAEEGSPEFVEQTLAAQRGLIRLLRRYFESLSPSKFRRLAGQIDGEDVDLDALVRRVADIRAGTDPSDHIYIRGERRERDVAAAVLMDVSGSTSRLVSAGRRIIDIEKEGLVLLCEALDAVGDQFALYGYSGQGRKRVDFIVIKDFDDPVSGRAARKLGGVVPLHQNRDGAAIRHATRKLLDRRAKTRLLVLINDGRPLDDGYKDDYSLEDTKMALREARMSGVEPFC